MQLAERAPQLAPARPLAPEQDALRGVEAAPVPEQVAVAGRREQLGNSRIERPDGALEQAAGDIGFGAAQLASARFLAGPAMPKSVRRAPPRR